MDLPSGVFGWVLHIRATSETTKCLYIGEMAGCGSTTWGLGSHLWGWEFCLGLKRKGERGKAICLSFLSSKLWDLLGVACNHIWWSNKSIKFVHHLFSPNSEIYLFFSDFRSHFLVIIELLVWLGCSLDFGVFCDSWNFSKSWFEAQLSSPKFSFTKPIFLASVLVIFLKIFVLTFLNSSLLVFGCYEVLGTI